MNADGSASDPGALRFGVEAEFLVVGADGALRDFRSLRFDAAQRIVDRLPDDRHPQLVRGDLGIKAGRWYVEGDERFDDRGGFVDCVPKGFETRTPPLGGIGATLDALASQTAALARVAALDACRLATVGWNPHAGAYRPDPPYNGWERTMRRRNPVYRAPDVYMLSYGPDLNLSHPDWSDCDVIDIARTLTALSPALVPFSFSAPFAAGRAAGVLSVRTHRRTGRRPAVRAFVDAANVPTRQPDPPLVHAARIGAERGRIEFKAFDALLDLDRYAALFALLAGIALHRPPGERAAVPDAAAHRTAAVRGFADRGLAASAHRAVVTARTALRGTGWARFLDLLGRGLDTGRTPAHRMLAEHERTAVVPLPPPPGAA